MAPFLASLKISHLSLKPAAKLHVNSPFKSMHSLTHSHNSSSPRIDYTPTAVIVNLHKRRQQEQSAKQETQTLQRPQTYPQSGESKQKKKREKKKNNTLVTTYQRVPSTSNTIPFNRGNASPPTRPASFPSGANRLGSLGEALILALVMPRNLLAPGIDDAGVRVRRARWRLDLKSLKERSRRLGIRE